MTYMLDLSALPDGGGSITELDDVGAAVLPCVIDPAVARPTYYLRGHVIIHNTDSRYDAVFSRLPIGEDSHVLLDCRRPSIQAHLLRWLAWRITGEARACGLVREGSVWVLTPNHRRGATVTMWVNGNVIDARAEDCPALRDIDDVGDAIAALVRAHA